MYGICAYRRGATGGGGGGAGEGQLPTYDFRVCFLLVSSEVRHVDDDNTPTPL